MDRGVRSYFVWDWPTRVLHWALALTTLCLLGLGGTLYLAGAVGLSEMGRALLEDIHVWIGYALAFVVVCRLVWAFSGNEYAKWRRMLPWGRRYLRDAVAYAIGLGRGDAPFYLGHNPLGRLAVLALVGLTLALTISGLVLSEGEVVEAILGAVLGDVTPDQFDQTVTTLKRFMFGVHRYAFFLMLAMSALHVTAVIVTQAVEGGALVSAMFTGRKVTAKEPVDLL